MIPVSYEDYENTRNAVVAAEHRGDDHVYLSEIYFKIDHAWEHIKEIESDFPEYYIRWVDAQPIFIPGNVPSSKNNKQVFVKYGKVMYTDSKATKTYRKDSKQHYEKNKLSFLKQAADKPKPLFVEFKFTRDSKRLFDLINAAQIVQDLMVEYGWIEDDNYTQLIPVFHPEVIVNKKFCGVRIRVL